MKFCYPPELKNMPPPQWIFDGLLQKDSLALLYGPSHIGKSFLALDMLFSIAAQHSGVFTPNVRSSVIYVFGEGMTGLGARIKAWETANGLTLPSDNPAFLGVPVQVANEDCRKSFIQAVESAGSSLGRGPALIVFDTLARCAVGLDENSAKDMGLLVDGLERIRQEFACAILLIHHSTKSNPKMERGSNAVFNAVETVLSFRPVDDTLLLECVKQKNGSLANTLRLKLAQVGGSCVISSA